MAYFKQIVRPNSFSHSVPFAKLTDQQQHAINTIAPLYKSEAWWREHCENHLISAVAGSGKTTFAVHLCDRLSVARQDASILFLAFQSDVKKTLEGRIPVDAADVRTCHGCGYGFPARTSKVRLAQRGYSIAMDPKWGDGKPLQNLYLDMGCDADHIMAFFTSRIGDDHDEKKADIQQLCKLLSLSKNLLAGLKPVYEGSTLVRVERDPLSVLDIANTWGMEFSVHTPIKDVPEHIIAAMEWTRKGPANVRIQGKGKERGKTLDKRAINADDQLWLPIVNGWSLPQYDFVIVDEVQDLSPARMMIVRLSLKPDGQLIAVGDEFQSIFGFAGADTRSIQNVINEFGCKVLPLTWTQRCARLVVNEARNVDKRIMIEARPDAIEGTIDSLDAAKVYEQAKPGDAVISRTNAPLIKLFFSFAKRGQKVVMLGRDYASMLVHRIKGFKAIAKKEGIAFDGHALLSYNQEWYRARIQSLGEGKAALKERAQDECMAIATLCTDLPLDNEKCADMVIDRCYDMFSSDDDGKNGDCVTLASTHKFKGDERNRVFLLTETYKPGGGEKTINPDEAQQETNLLYVAITRAKRHLTYVTGLRKASNEAQEPASYASPAVEDNGEDVEFNGDMEA